MRLSSQSCSGKTGIELCHLFVCLSSLPLSSVHPPVRVTSQCVTSPAPGVDQHSGQQSSLPPHMHWRQLSTLPAKSLACITSSSQTHMDNPATDAKAHDDVQPNDNQACQ